VLLPASVQIQAIAMVRVDTMTTLLEVASVVTKKAIQLFSVTHSVKMTHSKPTLFLPKKLVLVTEAFKCNSVTPFRTSP
jgi:hypothetical protein